MASIKPTLGKLMEQQEPTRRILLRNEGDRYVAEFFQPHKTEIGVLKYLKKNSGITHVDVSLNSLAKLPDEISYLPRLRQLDVSDNRLNDLPMSLSTLTKLETLDAMNNEFEELPAHNNDNFLYRKSRLKHVNLCGNFLKSFPRWYPEWSNTLTSLYLNGNRIEEIPPQINRLKVLTDLRLDHNYISEIPVTLTQMTWLETLHLRYNRIRRLPKALQGFRCLNSFYLDYNRLRVLPKEMSRKVMPNLSVLTIQGNPMVPSINYWIHMCLGRDHEMPPDHDRNLGVCPTAVFEETDSSSDDEESLIRSMSRSSLSRTPTMGSVMGASMGGGLFSTRVESSQSLDASSKKKKSKGIPRPGSTSDLGRSTSSSSFRATRSPLTQVESPSELGPQPLSERAEPQRPVTSERAKRRQPSFPQFLQNTTMERPHTSSTAVRRSAHQQDEL